MPLLHKSIWASLLLVVSALASAADCYDEWFCVELNRQHGAATVANITDFPVVVTVTGEWRDISGKTHNFAETLNLDGYQKATLFEFDTAHKRVGRYFSYSARWVGGVLGAKHDPQAIYHYPFKAEQKRWLVQGFNGAFSHYGASRYAVDFAVPEGTPVLAARSGVVIDSEARFNNGGASRRYARYANYIVILHDDGTTGEYYHLQQGGVTVKRGQQVESGELIGYSGNTGFSSLPHLHFAVYQAMPDGKFQSLPFEFTPADTVTEAPSAD
ncbi:M23 family metallopeptidase [Alteromonas sp. ASW11-36]|uniref:M23 family metallopeptidase n=1 Tax=Alteromonas arenosi TaxID=3055817 RepID=A0ABT7T189_9ALTE|nr:M23 family metallopeptidase [Alteromonas sp. ASW11-36]MDM7862197.1 M23 family metallopeptidase [Alteromonas sp. ASW11-36]